DMRAARCAVDLRGDRLEQWSDLAVCLLGASRHDARAVERTLLAAGDTGAHEVQTLLAQRSLTASGIDEMSVAAVDDDVAVVEQRREFVDDRVGRRARLHHHEDLA